MLIASTSLVASSNMPQRQPLRHKCLRPCKVQSFLIVSELLQALRLPKKLFSDVMISVILRCRDLGTAQTNCWSPLMFRAVDSRILKGGVKPTSTPSLRQLNSLSAGCYVFNKKVTLQAALRKRWPIKGRGPREFVQLR